MKKAILISVLLAFMLSAVSAFGAAGTITYGGTDSVQWHNNQTVHRVKITYLQPGAAAGDAFLLSSTTIPTEIYQGAVLFQIETDPGSEAPDVYTLTILSDKTSPILALTGLSATVSALHNGAADLGFTPIVFDLSIDFGDLGGGTEFVDLYLYFIK